MKEITLKNINPSSNDYGKIHTYIKTNRYDNDMNFLYKRKGNNKFSLALHGKTLEEWLVEWKDTWQLQNKYIWI